VIERGEAKFYDTTAFVMPAIASLQRIACGFRRDDDSVCIRHVSTVAFFYDLQFLPDDTAKLADDRSFISSCRLQPYNGRKITLLYRVT